LSIFQPPPTWAEVILVDEKTKKANFNPIWLKWFIDLVGVINATGGGGGVIQHNTLGGLQGGSIGQYYHFTQAAYNFLNGTLTPSNGGILWSDATKVNVLAGVAAAGRMLRSGNSATPSWSTSAWPTAAGAAGMFQDLMPLTMLMQPWLQRTSPMERWVLATWCLIPSWELGSPLGLPLVRTGPTLECQQLLHASAGCGT